MNVQRLKLTTPVAREHTIQSTVAEVTSVRDSESEINYANSMENTPNRSQKLAVIRPLKACRNLKRSKYPYITTDTPCTSLYE